MNRIASNLARLRANIASAARSAQRNPEEIKLVAASKTHPVASLEAALHVGQHVFGESTVQEALPKIAHFKNESALTRGFANDPTPEWHFIGHLQSNKAKLVPGSFTWVHSVDNLNLARRLSRFAHEQGTIVNALIEINVMRDPRKHGIAPHAVEALLEQLLEENLTSVVLRGLMAVGPYPAEEAEIRRAYAALRELRDDCARRTGLKTFDQLSMGMSSDYIQAIQEGATMLRIGTALFGERDYGNERSHSAG